MEDIVNVVDKNLSEVTAKTGTPYLMLQVGMITFKLITKDFIVEKPLFLKKKGWKKTIINIKKKN